MKQILEKLKEADILTDIDVQSVLESFEQQKQESLNAAKLELEENIRKEYAEKYRNDRDSLIAATEEMIVSSLNEHFTQNETRINELSNTKNILENQATEFQKSLIGKFKESVKASEVYLESVIQKHINDFQSDIDTLDNLKIKAAKIVHEAQDFYKGLFETEKKNLRSFTMKKLEEQVVLLQEKSNHLDTVRERLIENAREINRKNKRTIQEHMKSLDKAVVQRLFESIKDVNEEKRDLANTRVVMIKEARERITNTEKQLAKRFAEQADKFATKHLVEHLKEVTNEIEEARKANFGKKIFEAYMGEFLGSYYSDGTKTKELLESLRTKDEQIKLLESQVKNTNKKLLQESEQKQAIQDRAERQQVMNSLLSTLNGSKRETMRTLLESTKTKDLEKKFKYLLPQLNENFKEVPKKPQTLIENSIITGDNVNTVNSDAEDIARIVKLAGIKK